MQRIRMSLPYFGGCGWDAEIVTVDEKYADLAKDDDLLLQSIPDYIKIHKVKAFNKKWTSKLGLGSIALRSLWFYRQKVNRILKNEKIDLIYFSTTQFPICILGPHWKKRFDIPYIIDMQDPWYTGRYKNKPGERRPAKYRVAYSLHKYLEPIVITQVDGLIGVSEKYITDLKDRYPEIKDKPAKIITFGAFETDFLIAAAHKNKFKSVLNATTKNIVYIGRGGIDLHQAIVPVFETLVKGLADEPELFNQLRLYFIGTSYAPAGEELPTIIPLAKDYGLGNSVIELPERISYYHAILTLQQADALFIPGSDAPAYSASKIYPYIIINKPLLAIFNAHSPAITILNEYNAQHTYNYNTKDIDLKIYDFLKQVITGTIQLPNYNTQTINKYDAKNIAIQQCDFFNSVING
ncbi:MAG: hypothetical protein JWR67_1043 [Mucilaginibacter sp.]|nr:hypothetical protein [Mucilaginibacter sp.]